MTSSDVKKLLIYCIEHPKENARTCYDRWLATITHKLSQMEMQEALFIASHPVDSHLYTLIKEGKL